MVSFIPCRPLGLVHFDSLVVSKRLKVSARMHCIYPCTLMCFGCILDPYLTWWSHWIFLFYLVQNMFFGSFLNVFLPCLILFSYHTILLHSRSSIWVELLKFFIIEYVHLISLTFFCDMHTLRRISYYIGPFWHLLPMGEKFRGFKISIFVVLVVTHAIYPCYIFLLHGWVLYIEKSSPS